MQAARRAAVSSYPRDDADTASTERSTASRSSESRRGADAAHHPRSIPPEDLAKIEARMREGVKEDLPFERKEMSRDEGIRFFKEQGQDFKVELIESFDKAEGAEDGSVSTYQHVPFVDLCKGPHV